MQLWPLGLEDTLEKCMATHSSILAWRISRTQETGRLQSMVPQRVRHKWSDLAHIMDLTFKVPMQYCSLQRQILLLPPDTFTIEYHFHFGQASLFFLELFLWHLLNWQAHRPCCIFLHFHTVHAVLKARLLESLPSPVDHFFCQNSSPWPVHPRWSHTVWLPASLSYTKLWSMWSFWLAFYDRSFHSGGCGNAVLASSVSPLMNGDRSLCKLDHVVGLFIYFS